MGNPTWEGKKIREFQPKIAVLGLFFSFPNPNHSGVMGLVESVIPMILEFPWDGCGREYSLGRAHSRDSQTS